MDSSKLEELNFDPNEEINALPEVAEETNYVMEVDKYHSEVVNRSSLRRRIFLKWDTGNGFWKVGDDVIAGAPGQPNLFATIVKVNFPWQYWDNMQLLCQNNNPGLTPRFGDWVEATGTVKKACDTCPKNSRSASFEGKGKSCKDALQLVMSVLINGDERIVGFQSANFKLVGDFDDFLDSLKIKKLHLSGITVEMGRGKSIKVNGKTMFGWSLSVAAKQPLSEYAKTLNS